MFTIEVQSTFYATHALRLASGLLEPVHGHAFQVTVKISSRALDGIETVLDFHDIQRLVGEILALWTQRHLNDVEPFQSQVNPSAERIAEQIGVRLGESLRLAFPREAGARGLRLVEVRVTEAPGCLAIWTADPS